MWTGLFFQLPTMLLQRTSVLLLLLLGQHHVTAYPSSFLGGSDGGNCGKLVSELTGSSGMCCGYRHDTEAAMTATHVSGCTFTFPVSSSKFFITAKQGTLSSDEVQQGSNCANFVYTSSVSTSPVTVTWTLPSCAGSNTLEVAHASNYNSVIVYYSVSASAPLPPSASPPPPLPPPPPPLPPPASSRAILFVEAGGKLRITSGHELIVGGTS